MSITRGENEIRILLIGAVPENESGEASGASLFTASLSPVEQTLDGLLRADEARQIDELLSAAPQYSPSEVLAALLELEMKGRVRQLPGKHYVKVL